jgi:predicted Zn finger-like uncharacterized protein
MPRIACPSCGARYDVAAGVIGPGGKNVRCARCGEVWLARPEGEEAERPAQWPEPPPPRVRDPGEEPRPRPEARPGSYTESRTESALPPMRPAPPPRTAPAWTEPEPAPVPVRKRRAGAGALVAWAATLVLLAGAGYGAVTYPQAVIEAWPASARLYAMLGMMP